MRKPDTGPRQPPSAALIDRVVADLTFGANGLLPAIAQQHDTGEILMLAWMNEDAVRETLRSGRVCYYSRSRDQLWKKGETSGHLQHLVAFRFDCDTDAVVVLVDQIGPACHTRRRSCFYRQVGESEIFEQPLA